MKREIAGEVNPRGIAKRKHVRGRGAECRWSAGPGVKRVSTNELTNRVSGGSWRSRPIKRSSGRGEGSSRRTSYHPLLRSDTFIALVRGLVTNDSDTQGKGERDESSSRFVRGGARIARPAHGSRSEYFFSDRVNGRFLRYLFFFFLSYMILRV